MIEAHPIAFGVAAYLGVGMLAFLGFAWITARLGDPLIERSAGLAVNAIVVACLVPLIPLMIVAAPFISLHALLTGRWGIAGSDRLPPGFCLRFPDRPAPRTVPVDPLESPAYLRRQLRPGVTTRGP